jgi:hypothetical protein
LERILSILKDTKKLVSNFINNNVNGTNEKNNKIFVNLKEIIENKEKSKKEEKNVNEENKKTIT